MDRDALNKAMKALKAKARAARKAGKKDQAAAFKNGASHMLRAIKALPKPVAAKAAEG